MAPTPPTEPIPGLAARVVAAEILDGVLRSKRPLDEQLETAGIAALPERDRALVRALVATVLRRFGTLQRLLAEQLKRGLPKSAPRVDEALLLGAAQILFLDVPDHAAVDLSVRLAQADLHASHYAKLVNAVLRQLARDGKRVSPRSTCVMLDTPEWLMQRWVAQYGDGQSARHRHRQRARSRRSIITVKGEPQVWAERLGGRVLPSGSVRLIASGPEPQLSGFAEGAWWVQDAAAALPAKLLSHFFGDVRGKSIADLCAAPGGKTAQLAAAGARVTAVDRSKPRLARLTENLARLNLKAEVVVADASQWQTAPFDAVLIDAPCSSTGTIRRHPDVPWLKSAADLIKLTALQSRLLDRRRRHLVKPGGTLVYCTCSLEPEEGEAQIAALLRPQSGPEPRAGRSRARSAASPECHHRRRRSAHPALPSSRTRTPAWRGSTASMPPGCGQTGLRFRPASARFPAAPPAFSPVLALCDTLRYMLARVRRGAGLRGT